MIGLFASRTPWQCRILPILLLVLAACGRDGPADPEVDGLAVREIILAGPDGEYIFSHRDHWHGAPSVRVGGGTLYTVLFSPLQLGADDHDIPPVESWFTLEGHPEYSIQVVIENSAVGSWQGDRVRGTLTGLAVGASRMSIVVRRGRTTVYEAPPLNFRVRAP